MVCLVHVGCFHALRGNADSLDCLLYFHLVLQALFRPRWAGNFLSNDTQGYKDMGHQKSLGPRRLPLRAPRTSQAPFSAVLTHS